MASAVEQLAARAAQRLTKRPYTDALRVARSEVARREATQDTRDCPYRLKLTAAVIAILHREEQIRSAVERQQRGRPLNGTKA